MKRTKTLSAMSFAAYDVERRTRKGSFYAQVNTIIDWNPISAIIDKNYQKRAFHLGLKTLRWTPAVQNATHRDVEQSLGCQGRRACK